MENGERRRWTSVARCKYEEVFVPTSTGRCALVLCWLSLTLAVGCGVGDDKDKPEDMGQPPDCTPGAVQSCPCVGGGSGVQVCASNGKAWGPCNGCKAGNDSGSYGPATDGTRPDLKGTEPDFNGTDAGKPDVNGADAGKPDISGADAGKPDVSGADAGKPDVIGTDAGKPDVIGADAGKPDINGADINGPDAGKPDISGPNAGPQDGPDPDSSGKCGKCHTGETCIKGACVALNDTCSTAPLLLLGGGKAVATGDTVKATNSVDLGPKGCTGRSSPGPDLFYRVTLKAGATYDIGLAPAAGFDPALFAFTTPTKPTGSCIRGADVTGKGKAEALKLTPFTTTTYCLGVDSWAAGAQGSFSLTVALSPDNCGDGKAGGTEQCDGTDLLGKSCNSLGYAGGTLGCSKGCSLDTSGCAGSASCGDGKVGGAEACDGKDLSGKSCKSLGYSGGTLGCSKGCTLDTSGCSGVVSCGDGKIGGVEQCDGTVLSGKSCKSLGYCGGVLGCGGGCDFDTGRCGKAFGGYDWARPLGGEVADMAVDSSGGAVVGGHFSGTLKLGTTTLVSKGGSDLFVARLDQTGKVLWAVGHGGSGDEQLRALALDSGGQVVLAGKFKGSSSFGSAALTSKGSWDIFVARLDQAGKALWARSGGGSEYDLASGVGLDKAGNVYLTGDVTSPKWTGTSPVIGTTTLNTGQFVARLSSSGGWGWVKGINGGFYSYFVDQATDPAGNTYVVGSLQGTLKAGSTSFHSTDSEAYVLKVSPTGTFLWVNLAGNAATYSVTSAVAVDGAGNVFVSGMFMDTVNFDAITLASNNHSWDIFVARLTAGGKYQWVKSAGSTGDKEGSNAIAADGAGGVVITGHIGASSSFGKVTLQPKGGKDMFVASYDAAGQVAWAEVAGVGGDDQGQAVASNGAGLVAVAGAFDGSITLGSTKLTAAGSGSFVAKILSDSACAKTPKCGDGEIHASEQCDGSAMGGKSCASLGFVGGALKCTAACTMDSGGCVKAQKSLHWARGLGGTGHDNASAVAVDSTGNSYVAGVFQATAAFGSYLRTSKGNYDIFLTKLDPNSNVLWVRQLGGSGLDSARGVAVDAGGVLLSGWFHGSATFGTTALSSKGGAATFVTRLDQNGKVLWATGMGQGSGNTAAAGLSSGPGGVYVAGAFSGSADFGSTTLVSQGKEDIFVARLDAKGAVVWTRQAGGSKYDDADSVACDNAGNLYLAGKFTDKASFGSLTVTAQGNNIYLSRLDKSGNFVWVQKVTGGTMKSIHDIAVHSSGGVLVAGSFYHDLILGTIKFKTKGSYDGFVARYTTGGKLQWVRSYGAGGQDSIDTIAMGPGGEIVVAGSFESTVGFGLDTLISKGKMDAFVGRLDKNGTFQWATSAGSVGHDLAYAVALDGTGNITVVGTYLDQASFGSTKLPFKGNADAFVARYK